MRRGVSRKPVPCAPLLHPTLPSPLRREGFGRACGARADGEGGRGMRPRCGGSLRSASSMPFLPPRKANGRRGVVTPRAPHLALFGKNVDSREAASRAASRQLLFYPIKAPGATDKNGNEWANADSARGLIPVTPAACPLAGPHPGHACGVPTRGASSRSRLRRAHPSLRQAQDRLQRRRVTSPPKPSPPGGEGFRRMSPSTGWRGTARSARGWTPQACRGGVARGLIPVTPAACPPFSKGEGSHGPGSTPPSPLEKEPGG
jgi:hypothetical protein